ncbi:2-Methylisocitrate lyase, PEP mutase family [Cupriavidus sp. YR651]|uniref:isocitrate lyase/PEP mutase family protein n=1 Tax=Cupriavidus sp. YR651 TaxID=1855315 RepID=UPI00088D1CFD|nr:isocitrate lyase/PEP mutase family protein [Cupriavidus sp. YR651]SDD82944.1 2-Methylisocitrate lyase, PEP mutase family [Cupriavidus sp. YR651]
MTSTTAGSTPSAAAKRHHLRKMLKNEPFIVAPAVHDVFSLRLVEKAGFQSACISGAMLSYGMLGVPDIGLLTLSDTVDHCRKISSASRIPITADADAGFGNSRGVYYSVQLFEDAGAAGVNLEDQVVPKRWGAGPGKEVVSTAEMVSKIRAASSARQDENFLIIIRSDAFATESLEQVLERVSAYQDAGADMLLPIAPRSEANVERLVHRLDIPVSLSIGTGLWPSPSAANLSLDRIRALGVRRVSLTTLLHGASVHAMGKSLVSLQRVLTGEEVQSEHEPAVKGAKSLDALFDAVSQFDLERALLT